MKLFRLFILFLFVHCLSASDAVTLRQVELAQRASVADVMERVAAYQIDSFGGSAPTDWKTGTFFSGVVAAYNATGDEDYLQYATAWSESAQWKIPERPLNADQLCTGQTYLDLYLLDQDPEMIADLKAKLELTLDHRADITRKELGRHTYWKEEARPFIGRNVWWWCDSLYMAPPVLARMSAATGDPRYLESLHELYWDSVDFLYDPTERLFFRDEGQFARETPGGKKVFWGRGNGWVYGGLVRVLEYLPADDPQREKYLTLFRELTRGIIPYQQDDGLWRSSLNEPSWYSTKETSGSSFFCYGLLAGINRGYLDRRSYLPVALRAWEGLLGCINAEGRLGYAQLVAGWPGPVRADHSVDYTNGAFLLAASELYKMDLTADEVRELFQQQEILTLQENAAWTWYNDERAIVIADHLMIGSVDSDSGAAKTTIHSLSSGRSSHSIQHTVLSSWQSLDDHNNPAFLALDEGPILAVYGQHHRKPEWQWRLADPVVQPIRVEVDFKWEAEQTYSYDAKSTYSNLVQLSDEGGRIFNFFRGINFNPSFATSDDGATTWSAPTHLIREDGQRPYVKYASNGKDRIDFLFTDGHPRNVENNNVYHMYYKAGDFCRSDGSLICSFAEVIAGRAILPTEATLVYAGDTEGRGWVHDLEYDQNGQPLAVYISSADGEEGLDLRYRYARFDAVTSQWSEQQIAYAGKHLYAPENHYAGGISLDPNDANAVYISTCVEPLTGEASETGRYQIYRGLTADNGQTWEWTQLTFDPGVDNIRPFVVRQSTLDTCVLWVRGRYTSYFDFDTDIVGILNASH